MSLRRWCHPRFHTTKGRSAWVRACRSGATYHLVVANDSHHTQWLHAILLRIEVRVAEHDIGVQIRIQVFDPVLAELVLERCLALSGLVGSAVTAFVVQSVTVDVHVVVLAAVGGAVQVDSVGDVSAVGKGVGAVDAVAEAARKLVVAFSGLRC